LNCLRLHHFDQRIVPGRACQSPVAGDEGGV
jgi:hypothetical protein